MLKACSLVAVFLSTLCHAGAAQARTLESGSFTLSLAAGPSVRLGSTLGGARTYGTLALQGEYVSDPALTLVADGVLGLSGSPAWRAHFGPRARLPSAGLPLAPFIQLQATVGRIYNVIGADLTVAGARVGFGLEYTFTAQLTAGFLAALDLTSTFGERNAAYSVLDVLLSASYTF